MHAKIHCVGIKSLGNLFEKPGLPCVPLSGAFLRQRIITEVPVSVHRQIPSHHSFPLERVPMILRRLFLVFSKQILGY